MFKKYKIIKIDVTLRQHESTDTMLTLAINSSTTTDVAKGVLSPYKDVFVVGTFTYRNTDTGETFVSGQFNDFDTYCDELI